MQVYGRHERQRPARRWRLPVYLGLAVVAVAALIFLVGCSLSGVIPQREDRAAMPMAIPSQSLPNGGTLARVTSVHDGDTFTISTGDKVRVLVIDSCELGTGGGTRARAAALGLLTGKVVTLTRDERPGGRDRDQYGRLLRRVTLPDGRDFGDVMLEADHTAVYQGRQDASPAKVAEGRAHDANGRRC